MPTNDGPKVSIIIPVYNVESYLVDCLESVIHQTLQEVEIICVNDASSDQSLDILTEYANKDKRVTIINNSLNGGLSKVRNQGLTHARGKYVYFLDSDDLIVANAMEDLYKKAEEKETDFVSFEAQLLFESNDLKKRFHSYSGEFNGDYSQVTSGENLFIQWVQNRDWVSSVCRQFWRREYLVENDLKFFESIVHEDELFTVVAVLNAKCTLCVKKPYFIRRIRSNSITTTEISKRNFIGLFICYVQVLAFWEDKNCGGEVNEAIAIHVNKLANRLKELNKKINEKLYITEIEKTLPLTSGEKLIFYMLTAPSNIGIAKQSNALKDDIVLMNAENFSKIIIYGAGVIAKEVLELLNQNGKPLYCFAVSDRAVNTSSYIMGHPVVDIKDLTVYKKDALVLIGASPKYQPEIYEKLKELEFVNIRSFI